MQINTSLCEISDDSFEYYNTCKSPIKWISTCLLTSSPNKRDPPQWYNYKKTFREHFICNGENLLNIHCVSKTIKDAITIHKEKYGNKISRQDITNTVLWCCQQNPHIKERHYDDIIKEHLTQYADHILHN